MKILTRDDTEHGVEYVTKADADREIEGWKIKAKDIAKDYLSDGLKSGQEISKLRYLIRETIMENLHLAGVDDCTLKRLRGAIGFELEDSCENAEAIYGATLRAQNTNQQTETNHE